RRPARRRRRPVPLSRQAGPPCRRRRFMIRNALLGGLLALPLLSLAACQRAGEPPPMEPARPVLSMLVKAQSGPQMRLAGTIASQVQADLAFRLAGRLASRSVNV